MYANSCRSLFKYQKSQQLISKLYPGCTSFVVDNMASKSIPKRRKEKNDAWSKDKLTWHIGGTFFDDDDSIRYFVYPELVNESANTIISQIHETLHDAKNRNVALEKVHFIFDNHTTQKV